MLFIAIPAHNEVETIGVLMWRVRSVLARFPRDYHVVVFDDASNDGTIDVLLQYEKVLPLTIIQSKERHGYAGAVDKLLRHIVSQTRHPRRDAVLLLQGDFTDPPELIPEFARRFEGGADLVIGERISVADAPKAVHRLFRYTGWSTRSFVHVDGVRDVTSSYRMVRTTVIRDLLRERGNAPLLEGNSWTANADLLLRMVPYARRLESVPVQSTYGMRIRDTRREAMRDAIATLKWAWSSRKRRPSPDARTDQERRPERRPERRSDDPTLAGTTEGELERAERRTRPKRGRSKRGRKTRVDGTQTKSSQDTERAERASASASPSAPRKRRPTPTPTESPIAEDGITIISEPSRRDHSKRRKRRVIQERPDVVSETLSLVDPFAGTAEYIEEPDEDEVESSEAREERKRKRKRRRKRARAEGTTEDSLLSSAQETEATHTHDVDAESAADADDDSIEEQGVNTTGPEGEVRRRKRGRRGKRGGRRARRSGDAGAEGEPTMDGERDFGDEPAGENERDDSRERDDDSRESPHE